MWKTTGIWSRKRRQKNCQSFFNINLQQTESYSESSITSDKEEGQQQNKFSENALSEIIHEVPSRVIASWVSDNLNEEQIKAVINTEGYIRIIAGAGTGKTKTLTYRYAYLVKELGILPRNILCVTFTNKAANEMKKRIRQLIGDSDLGFICTFHSVCVQILREDIYALGYPKNFMVLDEDDVESILKTVYENVGLKSTNYSFKMARDMIRKRKHLSDYISLLINEDWIYLQTNHRMGKYEDIVFYGYLYEQRKCYGLDYDDLLLFALYLFKNKTILNKWQQRFHYVMVDEFQDVSQTQYILTQYFSDIFKNLFIVGDPDQTIYSWRGANVEYILNFDKNFPNVLTIMLEQNYRSTANILDASNSLIRKNKMRIDKTLFTKNTHCEPVLYYHAQSTKEEADWIAKSINLFIKQGSEPSSICILYRAHYVSRSIEEALINNNITYKIFSGIEFYQRKEIKDVISYLRMILYLDDLSFTRIINEPKRGFGKKRLEFLKKYSTENSCTLYSALKDNIGHVYFSSRKILDFIDLIDSCRESISSYKVSDLVGEILTKSGYELMLSTISDQERLDNIAELKHSIFEYENSQNEEFSLEDYLNSISLFTNLDKKDLSNSVKLMTIHSAKGLEFSTVFVCGFNEGIFPGKRVNTIEKLEEERRLAYVALTRAKERLLISEAEGYNYNYSFRYPSRFIFNIDDGLITYLNLLPEFIKDSAIQYIKNNEESMFVEKYNVGDMINHPYFGKGQIESVLENIGYSIVFEQLSTARTISFDVKLEKI